MHGHTKILCTALILGFVMLPARFEWETGDPAAESTVYIHHAQCLESLQKFYSCLGREHLRHVRPWNFCFKKKSKFTSSL